MTTGMADGRGERTVARIAVGVTAIAGSLALLLMMAWPMLSPSPVPAPAPLVLPEPVANAAPASAVADAAPAHHLDAGVVAAGQRTGVVAAPRPQWVRVRALWAGVARPYSGPLHVAGEPAGPRQVPFDTGSLVQLHGDGITPWRLTAPGFVPQDVVPPRDADPEQPMNVDLQPTSSLQFRWQLGANVVPDSVKLELSMPESDAFAGLSVPLPLAAVTAVAVTAATAVRWTATLHSGSTIQRVHGTVTALGADEEREVTVQFGADSGQRCRLVGASPALLPHLSVWWPTEEGRYSMPLSVDGEGVFTRPSDETGAVEVVAIDQRVATEPQAGVGEQRFVLREPLLGVQVQDESGAVLPSQLVDGGIRRTGTHVFRRAQLPPQLRLRIGGEVSTFAIAQPPADVDMLVLRPAAALPPLCLMVQVAGSEPPGEVRHELRLAVAQGRRVANLQKVIASGTRLDVPAAGEWCVHWRCGDVLGPEVARVMVAPGPATSLRVEWPVVHEWTGEIVGFTALPFPQRWHRVGIGAGDSVLAGWVQRPDARGNFRGWRFADEVATGPAFLAWGLRRVEAVVERCDPVRRHLVVAPSAALRWVDVNVMGADRDWSVQVYQLPAGGAPRLVHVLTPQQRWPVPVVGSEAIVLVLCPKHLGRTPVSAWTPLAVGDRAVTLAPMAMRALQLRDGRTGGVSRTFSLVGPHGVSAGQIELPAGGSTTIDVPIDTRAVVEWVENATEIAVGATDVIVLP
jgi:hypothetical protein